MQALDEEFGSTLMAELDSIFPGTDTESAPAQQEETTATPTIVEEPLPTESDTGLEKDDEPLPQVPGMILRVAEPKPQEEEADTEQPPEFLEMGEATNPEDLLSLEDAIAQGLIPPSLVGE